MKVWVWDSPDGVVAFRGRRKAQEYVTDHYGEPLHWRREDDTVCGEHMHGKLPDVWLHRVKVQ